MRLSGTAYNGNTGSAAEGAVVSLRAPSIDGSNPLVYSTFVGSDGTWTLVIPGTPGTSSILTIAFQGKTRTLSTRQLQLGMTPSWSPFWMSALAHRNGSGVSRNGVASGSGDGCLVSQTGPGTVSISPGCVAHTDFDSDDNYWMASWETVTSFNLQQFTYATSSYGALSSGGTWMLGVERQADGRCVFQMASLSGTTGTTPQATYSDMIGGWNDNFIPLVQITRSGTSITAMTSYRSVLYEGRFSSQPVLSVIGGQTGSLVVYDGVDSDTFDSTSLTITARSAGQYVVDGKAQVMTKETGAVPYWAASSFGSTGSGDDEFNTPNQIARDSSGNIYIADTSNSRLKKHQADGTYVASITSLTSAQGVALDSSGNIYVIRTVAPSFVVSALAKYNSSLVHQWTVNFSALGWRQVATDGTHVWITDGNDDTIHKRLCSTGASVAIYGSSGSGDGQFNTPVGIAFDGTYLYVVDQGNDRVQKLTTSGVFVTKWGSSGTGNGQFLEARGVAVHPTTGNIWVTDYSRGNIQEFTTTGTYVSSISIPGNPGGVVFSPDGLTFYVTDFTYDWVNLLSYTTPPGGEEWYDLQCEMFYKINAGSWVSMGSKNVSNFSVMPDFWSFAEDSASITLAASDTIQFRVTLSNTDTGSLAWDSLNYQFRLLPLGNQ